MLENENLNESQKPQLNIGAVISRFPCKKIRAGKYEYRGWIINCVGYYEPEQRVCWEAYDPKTGCGDFHGYSKQQIKWLIDESLSKNGG